MAIANTATAPANQSAATTGAVASAAAGSGGGTPTTARGIMEQSVIAPVKYFALRKVHGMSAVDAGRAAGMDDAFITKMALRDGVIYNPETYGKQMAAEAEEYTSSWNTGSDDSLSKSETK